MTPIPPFNSEEEYRQWVLSIDEDPAESAGAVAQRAVATTAFVGDEVTIRTAAPNGNERAFPADIIRMHDPSDYVHMNYDLAGVARSLLTQEIRDRRRRGIMGDTLDRDEVRLGNVIYGSGVEP